MSNNQYPQMPTYVPQSASQQPTYTHSKRRQSVKVHIILLLTTGGLGNIFYTLWANSKTAARYEW